MKYIYQNKTKSFTLLELLITIAVSSIIILCCIYIFFGIYFENEITDSVLTKISSDGIKIKKYRYSSYLSEKSSNTITKVNDIEYKKIKVGNKYEIRRISKDTLNSTNYGNNLLINDLDFFDVEYFEDYLVLRYSFNNKEYFKYILLKNIKYDYINGED